jgi:putative ABC transport system substrate-binding protein
MRRREFLTVFGGAAVASPLTARAQQPKMPVVGYLHASSPETNAHLVAAFRKGLSETGYIEGRNVAIEFRWAQDDLSRLPELAADLARREVAVIVTPASTTAAKAAKSATSTIPIVFSAGADPVQVGLVDSFNRPGGNVTGLSFINVELGAKRLEFLLDLRPNISRFGLLVNSQNKVTTDSAIKDASSAAVTSGRSLEVLAAGSAREIDTAFDVLAQKRVEALVVVPDPMFTNRRVQLATHAARHMIPVVYPLREFAEAGGLMSYGANNLERNRQIGIYAGRILKGEKPADMPIQRPTKFEFVFNLQTARILGLTVPPTLLTRADEVIE